MPRRLLLPGLWLFAAALAVAVAWQGVAIVADQVTERRRTPLSEERVLAALRSVEVPPAVSADPGASPATTAPAGPAPGGSSPTTRSNQAMTGTSKGERPSATSTTTTSSTVGTAPAGSPATTAPALITTTSSPSDNHTSAPPAPPTAERPSTERIIQSDGGAIAIRYSDDGVMELFWARPHDGFGTEIVRNEPSHILVRFRSNHHESSIDVTWDGTRPVERVQEGASHAAA